MVDKKDVLLWDLWFAVMQTVVRSLVVVLSVTVLWVGAAYLCQFDLILLQT